MPKFLTAEQAAQGLRLSPRQVRRMCVGGKLSGVRKVNGEWQIPPTVDARLIGIRPTKQRTQSELVGFSAKKIQQAQKRLGVLLEAERFAADYAKAGRAGWSEAFALYASQYRIDKATLYRWRAKYQEYGLAGLVDMRGGRIAEGEAISDEGLETFLGMYLTQQRLSTRLCLRNLEHINRKENKGWTIPNLRVMQSYVKNHIPKPAQILYREGVRAYKSKCAPHIEIDCDSIEPGEVWVGDHYQFNVWIRHRNRWIRPWLTAWQDMRSRMLVGWYVCALPNQTTILIATRRAVEKFGPPDFAKVDNGRDYDSEMWTGQTKAQRKKCKVLRAGYLDEHETAGLYGMMGITVSFAIPYNARAKRIERLFRTIDGQFNCTFDTYCGQNAMSKPDDLAKKLNDPDVIASALSLEEFAGTFDKYADVYNSMAHTGKGMEGRSPAQVLATRTSERRIASGVLDMLLCEWSGELKVGKNGVRFKNLYYGQYSQELFRHFGKKVKVACNPDDLRCITVYDAKTLKRICIVEQNLLVGYGKQVSEEDLREAIRQQRTAEKFAKVYRDMSRTVNMNLTNLTIEAAREKTKPEPKARLRTLRAVRTPFDGQVAEHERDVKQRKLKKAAGAEGMEESLDFDFESLRQEKYTKPEPLDFPWERND